MKNIKWPAEKKKEALDAVIGGMAPGEVSKITGIPSGTISSWKHKHEHPRATKSSKTLPTAVLPAPSSLEQFISGLKSLIDEYERLKSERELFRKQVEKWQTTAGKLNDELQSLAHKP